MATRALYTFTGFPETPVLHLYLHHDGYPTGAACRFAAALRHHPGATAFLSAFRSTQPAADVLAGSEQAADAEYRYVVELLPGPDARLQLQGWRRLPGANSWTPRCGPMELAVFIERFLPGGLPGAEPAVLWSPSSAGQQPRGERKG